MTDYDAARGYAIGWLVSVLSYEHPGWLTREAARAETFNPAAAEVIRKWAERYDPPGSPNA